MKSSYPSGPKPLVKPKVLGLRSWSSARFLLVVQVLAAHVVHINTQCGLNFSHWFMMELNVHGLPSWIERSVLLEH